MYIKVTNRIHLMCLILSLILSLMFYKPLKDTLLILYLKGYNSLDSIIIFYLLMIPITILHELIHAAFYKLFGGKVKIGFKGVFAYSHDLSEKPISRIQFSIVLLSPIVIISIVAMLINSWIGAAVFILNFVGSSADIYMVYILMKAGKCKIVDKPDGFEVII